MGIAYTWTFPALDVALSEDGLTNVVKTVHWRYAASDGTHTAEAYSTVALSAPGKPFTSYDDLTPEMVTGWVVAALGADAVAEMDASLARQIENQKNPPVVALPPPWQD